MRLFFALTLPEGIRQSIGRELSALRPALPDARWVPPDRWHLPLAFLGDCPPGAVEGLASAVGAVVRSFSPARIRLQGGGCFPPRRPGRIVWVGVEGDDTRPLQRAVSRAAHGHLGTDPDRRPFSPHLTVARCREPWPPESVEAWEEASRGLVSEPFVVEEVSLIESLLHPSGVRYTVRSRLPLEAEGER